MKLSEVSLLIVLIFSNLPADSQVATADVIRITLPGKDVELMCDAIIIGSGSTAWRINGSLPAYSLSNLRDGAAPGHNVSGRNNIVIEDIMMNDVRNGSQYQCEINSDDFLNSVLGNLTILYVAGVPAMVPNVTVDDNVIYSNGSNVTLTLIWGEPFNNLDPIVNYIVSYSSNVTCPRNFTTTDNTTRSHTITNLTAMANYNFSVVATNSIGSGEAGVLDDVNLSGEEKVYIDETNLTCKPMDIYHMCNVAWNAVSQENTTVYQVFYNNMMMNISSSTVFTFILQPLLDDVRIDTVSVNIIAINRCGLILGIDSDSEPINASSVDYAVIFVAINLTSYPMMLNGTHYVVDIFINISLIISALNDGDPVVRVPNNTLTNNVSTASSLSDLSDATFVHIINETSDGYSMTIIINLHNNSGANEVNITVMPEEGDNITESVIANGSMAVVTITELKCETDYTVIAGGEMGDGKLAGPKLILGKPPKIPCVSNQSHDDPNVNVTSTPAFSPMSNSTSRNENDHVAYIVSGVVCGGILAVIAIILIIVAFCIFKRRSKDTGKPTKILPDKSTKNKAVDLEANTPPKKPDDVMKDENMEDQKETKQQNELLKKQDVPDDQSNDDQNDAKKELVKKQDVPDVISSNDPNGQNEGKVYYADLNVLRGPQVLVDDGHNVCYSKVAGAKP